MDNSSRKVLEIINHFEKRQRPSPLVDETEDAGWSPWYPADPVQELLRKLKQACVDSRIPKLSEAAKQPDRPPVPDSFAEQLHCEEYVTDWQMEEEK